MNLSIIGLLFLTATALAQIALEFDSAWPC